MKSCLGVLFLVFSLSAFGDDLSQESAFQIQVRRIYIHDYDLRFASLGLKYLYKPLEFSGFGLEPHVEVLIRTEGEKRHLDFVPQLGCDFSFTILAHSPFIGFYASHIRSETYKGARLGYRYFIGQHVLGVAYDRQRAESDVYDSTGLIYAYTF